MPSYKLVYFDGRGRAELARLLFVAAGQKYEDKRVTPEEWPAMKSKTPLGALPILQVDGKEYAQSMAIARYLAAEFCLDGKTKEEKLKISEVLEAVSDIRESIYRSFDLKTGQMNVTEKLTDDVQAHLVYFLNTLKDNQKNGFMVGATATVADLAVFDILELMAKLKSDLLEKPERAPLKAFKQKISELPKIKEYLPKRTDSSFGF